MGRGYLALMRAQVTARVFVLELGLPWGVVGQVKALHGGLVVHRCPGLPEATRPDPARLFSYADKIYGLVVRPELAFGCQDYFKLPRKSQTAGPTCCASVSWSVGGVLLSKGLWWMN